MAKQPPITPEELRTLLRYDPETGKLFWRLRARSMFKTASSFGCWNARFGEKEALTAPSDTAYRTGHVMGRPAAAHRVAWAIHHGYWPNEIDHLNGDRADNRIENLREVTRAENSKNHGKDRRNKSGYTGVHWATREGMWQAVIRSSGKTRHLGFFRDVHAAGKARQQAALRLGYSQRHCRHERRLPRNS